MTIWHIERYPFRSECPLDWRCPIAKSGQGKFAMTHANGTMIRASSLSPFAAIFWGGLLAGVFDLTQAFVAFGLLGATPYGILQHIAAGILGMRSYRMGWISAALGFTIHFTIASTAATVYYASSRRLRFLVDHPVICGLMYGEAIFVFMYFVVLPLSALGPARFSIATYITGPIGHPLLVGLPIALSVRRFRRSSIFRARFGGTGQRDCFTATDREFKASERNQRPQRLTENQ
jgi:hypothetical protein